ncbi:oligopeptide/dipeptide ABC transporter ATP-binding protein [Martelella sp. HB161492]|uniref:ABC transporter ATP-binding protein n=1 Tax=Martelella sp. HB161492 TaxID=2720726 RepID=UPI00159108F0|nr:oligopeptide/dipeptide ABC transporter ATP-binding protein [Martelella sp. HB161492]
MTSEIILRADGVSKTFLSRTNLLKAPRPVHAVSAVNLEIRHGETFAIVGESGCGKSTLSRLLLDLIALSEGRVVFEGQDVAALKGGAKRAFRRQAQMIFQDPFSSLNPRMTVAEIIGEPIWLEGRLSGKERRNKVLDLMARVGLRPDQADLYPHEFSGGQRQRIGIARALAGDPKLIIGDEPVSALDVSVQAQIINLLEDLKHEFGLTMIIVAHDLVVVRHMSDRVAVMYLGQIVEIGPVEDLYGAPLHPYTQSLMAAVPVSSPAARQARSAAEGDLPDAANVPSGCSFHPRCPFARERCLTEVPHLRDVGNGHQAACHFYAEIRQSRPKAAAEMAVPSKLEQRLQLYRARQALTPETLPD